MAKISTILGLLNLFFILTFFFLRWHPYIFDNNFLSEKIVVGIFAILSMPRFLVVLLTAAAGAMGVIMGLLVLFGRVPEVFASLQLTSYIVANSWFWVMVWAALAAIGIGFQYILLTVFGKAELSEEYVWKKEYKKI